MRQRRELHGKGHADESAKADQPGIFEGRAHEVTYDARKNAPVQLMSWRESSINPIARPASKLCMPGLCIEK
ncbi:hypothetical protein BN2497_7751 [Janthinobacterium sp. CG23_2]|nr:hypothetical protein BN2497_7751 [Janthinobacterium sp. CG23_2]CUU30273.1 hypothetical protein BN3177_7751 [Janthinobacterium sp. CG23_2]